MCKLLLNIVFHLRSSLLSKQWNNIFLLAWVSVVTYKNPPQNDVLAAIASQLVSYAVAWFSLVIRAQCVCFALYILFFRMQGCLCVQLLLPPDDVHFLPGGATGVPMSLPRSFIPITRSILPRIKLLGMPRPAS